LFYSFRVYTFKLERTGSVTHQKFQLGKWVRYLWRKILADFLDLVDKELVLAVSYFRWFIDHFIFIEQ
jgi:hypothetical protein